MATAPLMAMVKAVRKESWREALELALAMWRPSRDGVLGRLVLALGQRVDASIKPLTGPKADVVKEQLAWAKKRDPFTLGRLLEPNPVGNWADRHRLMEALTHWPADPRIGHHGLMLARSFQRDHLTSPSYFPPLLDVLLRHADGAVVEAAKNKRSNLTRDEARALAEALEGANPLSAAARKEVEALLRALENAPPAGDGVEAALLSAIYAHPEDDAVRAVYADALTARGDARGEFITLQLAPKLTAEQRKRVKELLATHEKTWSGPLTVVLEKRQYERGFLVAGELIFSASAEPELHPDAPEWQTLERLKRATPAIGRQFHQLVELETSEPLVGRFPRLETLDVWKLKHLVKAELPKLRSLRVTDASTADLKAFFQRPAGQGLTSLTLGGRCAAVLPTLPLPVGLQRLTLSDWVTLVREPGGWRLELRSPSTGDSAELGASLAFLEKKPLAGVTFAGTWSRFGPRNLADEVGPKLRALITTFVEESRGKFEK